MAIKPRHARKEKQPIAPWLTNFFISGEMPANDPEMDKAFAFSLRYNKKLFSKVWSELKAEILKGFTKTSPCERPHAWWKNDAPEKRRKVSGAGEGWTRGMAVDSDGTPKYWQLHWDEKDPPCFESQALFLKRHGLLTPAEKRHLKEHRELLQPEVIEYDDE